MMFAALLAILGLRTEADADADAGRSPAMSRVELQALFAEELRSGSVPALVKAA